jgi:NodT family efflux transporter outer membrane factor (OMF) lipoprotein
MKPGFAYRRPAALAVRVVATGVLALAASCASVGPDYRAPDANALRVPSTWIAGEVAAAAPPDELATWWRGLGDPTLDALIGESLAASPTIGVARARLHEARARRDLAGANRYPVVTASASASHARASSETGPGGSASDFHAGFDASWEADIFGGQRRALEAAEADYAASAEDLRDTQVSLASEVALEYVQVRSLQARLAIARANLATQTETLQLTQWRTQAGLTSSLDVEQARTAVEQTRAALPLLETSLAQARNRLAILADQPPGALDERLAAPAPIPAVPATMAVGIPADTLRQRPDLRSAERRLAAETARIGQQEALRYPDLALSGSIGLDALSVGALGSGGAAASQVLARLAATIFDAGRLRRQVEIQTAVQERALHTYEGAVLTALEDVENALAELANTRARHDALANAVEAARNAALYAEQRYAAGITDFQTVLDTQRVLLIAEDSLKSTEADQASALIRLYKALGGGWSEAGSPATRNE